MILWTYKIHTSNGIVFTTSNTDFAEMKSKMGCTVFCKRRTNKFRFHHL